MNSKVAKTVLLAGTLGAGAVMLSCNILRDVVLVPDGGGSCAGSDFGMPCTGATETGTLIADTQTLFQWGS